MGTDWTQNNKYNVREVDNLNIDFNRQPNALLKSDILERDTYGKVFHKCINVSFINVWLSLMSILRI